MKTETKPNDLAMNEQEIRYEDIFPDRRTGLFIESYLSICQKDNTFKPIPIQDILDNTKTVDIDNKWDKLSTYLEVKYAMGSSIVKILNNEKVELTSETMDLLKNNFLKKN